MRLKKRYSDGKKVTFTPTKTSPRFVKFSFSSNAPINFKKSTAFWTCNQMLHQIFFEMSNGKLAIHPTERSKIEHPKDPMSWVTGTVVVNLKY